MVKEETPRTKQEEMRTYFISYAANGFLGNLIFDVDYKIQSSKDIMELQDMIERKNKFDKGTVVVINIQCLRRTFLNTKAYRSKKRG